MLIMKESEHINSNIEKWDKWAQIADGKGRLFDYLRKAQTVVISMLDIKGDQNFLDMGCGTGWAVGQAAIMAGNKGSFYGVDLSPKMIEKAKENFSGSDNFHFLVANSESVPIEDNFFDFIICTNSFHHYLHPEKAMKEFQRLLRKGGKVFILDPPADTWFFKLTDRIYKVFEPQHVKLYSTAEFKSMILDSGLKYSGSRKIENREKVHIGEK